MKATTAQTPATLAQKAIALLMALVLCMGLTPHAAWAEETGKGGEQADTFSVALTVVDTTDAENGVLANVKVDGMTADDTVADLLAKAGFSKAADVAATEGNDRAYADSYGSPVFRGNKTSQGADGNWTFWATMYNGDSNAYASAQLKSKLQANGHYQYIYGSASTFAYDEDSSSFPVQLTVVDTTDAENGVLANVKVDGMTADDTVADLLAKAGFSKAADVAATEGNDRAYADSYGSPVFRGNKTSQGADGNWTFWATMYNGDSNAYASAQLKSKLQARGHYQYIFGSASTFAYTNVIPNLISAAVTDPLAGSTVNPVPTPEPTPNPTPEPAAINKYDAAKAETLIANLSARFLSNGKDHAIGNNTFYAAIALNSLGKGAFIDADAILANLNKDDAMTAGRMGKYIMALTAAGIDCTKVNDNGTMRNLVAEMEVLEKTESMSVYDAVCILPVYQYGSYKQGDSAMAPSALIDLILANADDKGLFGSLAYGCDTQTTAQAILALLPYQSVRSDVEAAIKKAESALLSMENEDGSFAYSAQYSGANLDATANVIAALEALGYNCASDSRLTTSNGSTPLGYLTSVADENLAGYLDASNYDESATSAVVLMAFAAHEGARQADGAYSVYTLKSVTKEIEGADPNPDLDPEPKSDAKPLAQTGDDAATAAAAAIVLCALASGAVAVRRARRSRTFA